MRHLVGKAGLLDKIEIDSAGTGAYHAGERADSRARQVATQRGLELDSIARQFEPSDFDRFDYVIAMDEDNMRNLLRIAPDGAAKGKVALLRSFDRNSPPGAGVPDPYYGGDEGFDEVFDIVEAACSGLLDEIRHRHHLD